MIIAIDSLYVLVIISDKWYFKTWFSRMRLYYKTEKKPSFEKLTTQNHQIITEKDYIDQNNFKIEISSYDPLKDNNLNNESHLDDERNCKKLGRSFTIRKHLQAYTDKNQDFKKGSEISF